MKLAFHLVVVAVVAGCQSNQANPATMQTNYASLAQADEAYAAKNYSVALKHYDESISSGLIQPDVQAEALVKRAVCRMETGDSAGATDDLSRAEQGGAAGDEFENARKRLVAKK